MKRINISKRSEKSMISRLFNRPGRIFVSALVFILVICSAVSLLSGCAKKSGGSGGAQDKSWTLDNKNTPKEPSKEPTKEELLKDMMNVPMKDFEAVDLNGAKVKLSDYKGKIIFLNFWGTWCPPCRSEMPEMQKFYDENKDKGVVFLTVNSTTVELQGGKDSSLAEKQVKKFIQDNQYTFPVLLDKDNKAWDIYQQRGIPVNYVIDKQGIVRYGFAGAYQGKQQMEELLKNIRAIE